jgi:hypothetical protein
MYSGMIQHRDTKGRIARPSGPPHSAPKTRDERSERPSSNPGRITIRLPIEYRLALDNLAQRELKTLRFFADGAAKKWPLRGSLNLTVETL